MSAEWSVRARWLFPVDSWPIENGTLTMLGDKIVAVDAPGVRTPDLDLGNVAILPGLVNAHTHLDLGALRGKLPPPGDFTQWLWAVVAYRRSSTVEERRDSIRAGIRESLASGTTLIGDISAGGSSFELLAASPLRSVAFLELIGLTPARAETAGQEATAWLMQSRTERCRRALSPHAPYSVRHSLIREAAELAAQHRVPLAIHLAETREELMLLETHAGPLRTFLKELDAWDEEGLAPDLASVLETCSHGDRVLYAHANYLPSALWPRSARAAVVYCPRTHAFFGHEPHPYCDMFAAGVDVAFGTDSLASNPDLSILEEMRFLWWPDADMFGADALLRMGTVYGARALGWGRETGSLTPGKSADWITVPLPNAEDREPHRMLFDSRTAVRDVVIRGEWILRDGKRTQPTD